MTKGPPDETVLMAGIKAILAVYDRNSPDSKKPQSFMNWQVQGTCSDCGETCWSRAVEGLDGIGEMYNEFDPHYDHRCHPEPAPLTIDENLIDAIRQFIEIEVQPQ